MGLDIEQSTDLTIIHIDTDSLDSVSAREIGKVSDQMQINTVFDFGAVRFINSGGISVLLKLIVETRKLGKKLYAINVNDHHRKIFEMVNLSQYMPISTMEDITPLINA